LPRKKAFTGVFCQKCVKITKAVCWCSPPGDGPAHNALVSKPRKCEIVKNWRDKRPTTSVVSGLATAGPPTYLVAFGAKWPRHGKAEDIEDAQVCQNLAAASGDSCTADHFGRQYCPAFSQGRSERGLQSHELPLIFTKVLHFNLCSFVLICGFICVYCTVQMRRAHHK
jgi:hypothetical protein